MQPKTTFDGLIDAALEISARRRDVLRLLKEALERDDTQDIKRFAKKLCGMQDEYESGKPFTTPRPRSKRR